MTYEVKHSNIAPQLVAYARGTDTPQKIRDLFGRLMTTVSGHIAEKGAKAAGPPFTRYMEMDDASVTMWVGIPLREEIDAGGDVIVDTLPGGNIAMTTHIGSLDHLGKAHEAVLSWIDKSEYEQAGPPWEYYWGDPQKEPDPNKWKTEVFFPLK